MKLMFSKSKKNYVDSSCYCYLLLCSSCLLISYQIDSIRTAIDKWFLLNSISLNSNANVTSEM